MDDQDPTRSPSPNQPVEPLEPALEAGLRQHFGRVPADAVDWAALEARIVAGARPRLARRAWKRPAERWGRIAIPVGLAAAIVLAVGLYLWSPALPADDEPDMEQVAAVSASTLLPADPLSLTDQETFLAVMLDRTER